MTNFELHNNTALFIAAIEYTAAKTGINPELIEKDYYCTLLLNYLANEDLNLVFIGGTLLAKVHSDFSRLSEDLDFILPVAANTSSLEKSEIIESINRSINTIIEMVGNITLSKAFLVNDESSGYHTQINYKSSLDANEYRVLINIDFSNELSSPLFIGKMNALLTCPFSDNALTPSFDFPCLNKYETHAQKMQAAFMRIPT